ncbi:MAG: outer membrane beta-barrel protein [Gluconobacter sp.]|nr:outer membrane beta-barrel protein [Gluconobacter sp. Gdi]GFE97126.1 hypothetical protein DmGdi_21990 [Gluconobacter sp. Gdi]
MSKKHVMAVFCLLAGTALPSFAYAQAAASSNTTITPNGTPNPNHPTPPPTASHTNDAGDPDLPALKAGNLFSPKAGRPLTYWDGLVGHLTVEAGISGNPWTRSGRNFGQFYLDRANTVTLNQIMGSLSHPVTSIGSGYGIGFVVEMMYGSDSRFDPTIGMGDGTISGLYQWAPTQAHIDIHTPWIFHHGIDFQAGQMYGLMGAEGTPALARPFYSFNYAADYIVPFETVGVVATMHLSHHMDWILGIDAGNSTTFGGAGNNSRPKGYFGFAWNNLMGGKLNVHAIGHFGPQANNGRTIVSPAGWNSAGIGRSANDLMQYNADLLATYHVTDALSVMAEALYLHDDASRDDAYGVSSYLSWDIQPSLTLNVRGEIFRDNTGGIINQYSSDMSYTNSLRNRPFEYYNALPTTYGDLTVGVAYRPTFINRHLGPASLTVRPEIRLDKSLNGTHPFNQSGTVSSRTVNNGTNNMLWFNLDAVLSF